MYTVYKHFYSSCSNKIMIIVWRAKHAAIAAVYIEHIHNMYWKQLHLLLYHTK